LPSTSSAELTFENCYETSWRARSFGQKVTESIQHVWRAAASPFIGGCTYRRTSCRLTRRGDTLPPTSPPPPTSSLSRPHPSPLVSQTYCCASYISILCFVTVTFIVTVTSRSHMQSPFVICSCKWCCSADLDESPAHIYSYMCMNMYIHTHMNMYI